MVMHEMGKKDRRGQGKSNVNSSFVQMFYERNFLIISNKSTNYCQQTDTDESYSNLHK